MASVLALLAVTAVWGWTFVVVRQAIEVYPTLPFLGLRFVLGAALLAPLLRPGRSGFRAGIVPGIVLATGYLTQTIGLSYTTASQAGLFTGLYVVLTPVLGVIIFRTRPPRLTVAAVVIAGIGSAFLAGGGPSGGAHHLFGDFLEFTTAVLFALHIVLLGHFAPRHDAGTMAFTQLATAAVLFLGASVPQGIPVPPPSVLFALGVTGALASAAAFWVQTYVQQRVAPSRTALIMVAEPAFAAFFGVVLAGDVFSSLQWLGAAAILGALVLHEGSPYLRRQ